MAFAKGESGNPGGRPKEKPWADALRAALSELDADGVKKLRKVAQAMVNKALDGDVSAIREIGDRLDGKAVQAIASEDGGPLQIQIVRFTEGEK